MKKVRTRFAPSPTGYLHIGSLRTALFNYLLAKSQNGDFILRIEDTDEKRRVADATEKLIEILQWVGLEFDEGPHKEGPFAPYIQSQRKKIYQKYIQKLLDKGAAYYCFCSPERLKKLREEQKERQTAPRYDNHCRHLSPEEVKEKLAKGEPYVIRQKMPLNGTTTVYDELRGEIKFRNADLEDQILIKSDGMPTYQFASVVDDHLMEITHVIRGEEWISSFPKNILLYQAFGWTPPKFIHMTLTLNKEGGKLSKRHGDVAVEDFRQKGYLPEALLNYAALLGWHPQDEQEIFTLPELEKKFSWKRMGKSAAIFDIEKLKWINKEHLQRKSPEEFHKLALPYYKNFPDYLKGKEKRLSELLQSRLETLGEIPEKISFLLALPEYSVDLYLNSKMKADLTTAQKVLSDLFPLLSDFDENEWTEEKLKEKIFAYIQKNQWKNGQVLWPLRIALSGQQFTPGGAFEIAFLLGKQETLRRLKAAQEKINN